jgi:endonuclease/exonuclease/phosphatase family metal-dependent hydrolase
MDKLVRRVTVVQGSDAKVVYQSDDDSDGRPSFKKLEEGVRHMLKAQVIAAQAAYEAHVESSKKEGNAWLTEAPANFMKARKKAMKEMRDAMPKAMRKRMPFGMSNDDDEED